MKTLKFDKDVIFGNIIEVYNNLVLAELDDRTFAFDDEPVRLKRHIDKEEYDNFSDLKVGEECAVFYYSGFLWKTYAPITGIMSKNKYDNAIRDSQRLPKGWIHEPYYTVEETHGFIRSIERNKKGFLKIKILIDVEHSITISEEDYDISNITGDLGENVVIIEKTVILPNGKQKSYKPELWNKEKYLTYVENWNERKKKEEDQNRRKL